MSLCAKSSKVGLEVSSEAVWFFLNTRLARMPGTCYFARITLSNNASRNGLVLKIGTKLEKLIFIFLFSNLPFLLLKKKKPFN